MHHHPIKICNVFLLLTSDLTIVKDANKVAAHLAYDCIIDTYIG